MFGGGCEEGGGGYGGEERKVSVRMMMKLIGVGGGSVPVVAFIKTGGTLAVLCLRCYLIMQIMSEIPMLFRSP